ncbi:DUF3606 domain-containing protein [Mesorhizobium sp. CU2]|nr:MULTISPECIES: DUF3606 domain-containing protein [unclassified Mesorhizobium]TPN86688.1 DUF3606 domain-containing protein [Mesorhizobium sp. CU3]TPO20492.1 DUF3606 domain-containing protein [Mesorhizobium sp. CU2]
MDFGRVPGLACTRSHRVSASEDYEVRYFAKQHRITPEQVRGLISDHGNDRKTLQRES